MRKLPRYNVLIVIIALGIITSCIYGVLLAHASAISQPSYHSSVESLRTGELFWETISSHFVMLAGY